MYKIIPQVNIKYNYINMKDSILDNNICHQALNETLTLTKADQIEVLCKIMNILNDT